VRRLLRSTAICAFLAAVPFAAPDLFIYKSAQAANEPGIPSWIQASCCGPSDAHRLRPEQVHDMDEYYLVDGYHEKISHKIAQPSQDGDYWIFYSEYPGMPNGSPESQSHVYCFFVPMAF
jgi:hypothetical protein